MCLGVPGRIVKILDKDGLKMANVDFGGVLREVCLDYVPEAQVGDYCLVHAGFALSLLSATEAQETLSLLQDIARFEQEPSGSQ
ncbi:MAG: HypC/HybG/HupF family hydrogenase formation chaperone [Chloroflexota bacterium]